MQFTFNTDKALNVILYITKELEKTGVKANFHKVFKILYFADFKHISGYARPIIGDNYIAMEYGPVPSKIYDILKMLRGQALFNTSIERFKAFFEIKNNKFIVPKKEIDMDSISESEVECLQASIAENKDLSFEVLVNKSHGRAYSRARKDDTISFLEIGREANASDETLQYMRSLAENQQQLA